MKRAVELVFVLLIAIFISSCSSKGDKLTDRIQYDVTIISPETDLDWWVQNLENNKRETLVKSLMAAAKSGDHKVYDVLTFKEMTQEEIAEKGIRRDLMTLLREYPPYAEYDTLIVSEIDLSDISKVRFLEEWYLNEETGKITKKVVAMCPMLESYTESGELRGHLPLYWVSFVRKFPLAR
jgi:hypothetical protein